MSLADFIRQVSILLTLPAVIAMGLAAGVTVVARDWRLVLFAYAGESTILSLLLAQRIPLEWALLQAIVGGLVAVMFFLSASQLKGVRYSGIGRDARWPQLASSSLFRLMALALVALAFFAVHDSFNLPMPSTTLRDGVFWLLLVGALGLALHEEPMHAGLALLTGIGGFLLLYLGLTQSRFMIGLLAAWQLLIGLACSYLTVSRGLAGPPPDRLSTTGWRQ